ncbi:MAG: ABC transporter permease subunit [Lachnospiraceae bacterium]|nr:ABC transporter permease subunit [Lachnospiraceae bacterium]
MHETGQLWWGLWYSFRRITIATILSIGVAIPVALIIYAIPLLKETLMPVVSFLRFVPVTAFSPLLILWCGIGEKAKISFLFIATFVYFLPSVLLAFGDVSQDLLDTGRTIGMKRWEVIFEILLPASLPSICSTFLMMYGIGWTYCAVVEASNARYGLGFVINVSAARGRTNVVFGAIIIIMIFSFFFDKVGNWVIRKLFRWRFVNDHFE